MIRRGGEQKRKRGGKMMLKVTRKNRPSSEMKEALKQ